MSLQNFLTKLADRGFPKLEVATLKKGESLDKLAAKVVAQGAEFDAAKLSKTELLELRIGYQSLLEARKPGTSLQDAQKAIRNTMLESGFFGPADSAIEAEQRFNTALRKANEADFDKLTKPVDARVATREATAARHAALSPKFLTSLDELDLAIREGKPDKIAGNFRGLRQGFSDNGNDLLKAKVDRAQALTPEQVLKEIRDGKPISREELNAAQAHYVDGATNKIAADAKKVADDAKATADTERAAREAREATQRGVARGTSLDELQAAVDSGDATEIGQKFDALRRHLSEKDSTLILESARSGGALTPDEVILNLRNGKAVTRDELNVTKKHLVDTANDTRSAALKAADNLPSAMEGLTAGELKKFTAIGRDPEKAMAELTDKAEFDKWLTKYRNPLVQQSLHNDVNAAMAALDTVRNHNGKVNVTEMMNELRNRMRDPARSADPASLTGQIVDFVPRQKPLTYHQAADVIRNGGPISETEFSQFMGYFRQWDSSVAAAPQIVQQPMMGMGTGGIFAPLQGIGNLANTLKTLAQPDMSPRMAMTATAARQWETRLGEQPNVALRTIDSFRDRPFATTGRTLLYGVSAAAIAGTISAGNIFVAEHGTENKGYFGTLGFEMIHDHLDGFFNGGLTDKGGKLDGESEITSYDYQLMTKGKGVINDKFRDYTLRLTGITLGDTFTPEDQFNIATTLANNIAGKNATAPTKDERTILERVNPLGPKAPVDISTSGLNDANIRGYIAALASKMGWESAGKDHGKLPIDAKSLTTFATEVFVEAKGRQLANGAADNVDARNKFFTKYLGISALPQDTTELNDAIIRKYAKATGGDNLDQKIVQKYLEVAANISPEESAPGKVLKFWEARMTDTQTATAAEIQKQAQGNTIQMIDQGRNGGAAPAPEASTPLTLEKVRPKFNSLAAIPEYKLDVATLTTAFEQARDPNTNTYDRQKFVANLNEKKVAPEVQNAAAELVFGMK